MLYIALLDGSKNGDTHDLVSVKAAMNLKKLAIWKAKPPVSGQYTTFFVHVFQFFTQNNEEPAVALA